MRGPCQLAVLVPAGDDADSDWYEHPDRGSEPGSGSGSGSGSGVGSALGSGLASGLRSGLDPEQDPERDPDWIRIGYGWRYGLDADQQSGFDPIRIGNPDWDPDWDPHPGSGFAHFGRFGGESARSRVNPDAGSG
jgi:hypothetical protein